MCYHYSIAKTAAEIASRYNIEPARSGIDPEPLFYHVNGFEFPRLPVLYRETGNDADGIGFMQWGLVPGWVKGEEKASQIRGATLNARSETADSKPSFRGAIRYRPCLVPATGYFEWMHYLGNKYPYFIFVKDEPIFSFAGIWEEWVSGDTGEILRSFSILTCEANTLTSKIHNTKKRMPVILEAHASEVWLDTRSVPLRERKKLLQPFPAERMEAYTISRLITSRSHEGNSPQILEPYHYEELNKQD